MGKRKIVVSERDNLAAVFDDDHAVEFIIHRGDMLLGDVYLATVENILPSIDAAFVNVGGDKMGFLHSSDVPGKGDLKNRLQPKQQLVVQVMKEPTGHKGPRVTTNISLPGRFLVLMPESKGISISRKIESQTERARLKSIVSLIKPAGVGVIIRTEADQQKDADIQDDFETLLERWQNIVAMADTAKPPTLLYRDQDLLYRVIREAVTDDVREIIVDNAFGQQRAQQLLQNWNLDRNIRVQLHTGNQPILTATGVDKEIRQALQTKVPLPLGGYLYIQPTEALTVVDVNSGKFTSLQSQAETIKLTNLEAAKEIARQLRLRNIGGIIIVDFIDMESRADQLTVLQAFENELAPDKAKPQLGQLSDLGLVELTRHRQGQSLSEIFSKRCIACGGTGHAVEEFHWAQPNQDIEARAGFRPGMAGGGGGRSKLPLRQSRPSVPQALPTIPKPAASVSSPVGSAITLKKLLEPARASRPTAEPGALFLAQQRPSEPPTLRPPAEGAGRPGDNKSPNPDEALKHLDDHYREQLYDKLGIRLSLFVKCAHTPPMANSLLARVNPKCNDLLTLVDTIEGTAGMPLPPENGDEEDGDEAEGAPTPMPTLPGPRMGHPPAHPAAHPPARTPGFAPPARRAPEAPMPMVGPLPATGAVAVAEPVVLAPEPSAQVEPSLAADVTPPVVAELPTEVPAPAEEATPAPTLRPRGRPARRTPAAKAAEAPAASADAAEAPPAAEAEEKPRRRRGRPPKKAAEAEAAATVSPDAV